MLSVLSLMTQYTGWPQKVSCSLLSNNIVYRQPSFIIFWHKYTIGLRFRKIV